MCCFRPHRSSARDATAHFLHHVHFGRHTAQPEVLYCHPARVGGDTPHGTLTALLSCFSSLGLSLCVYCRLQMSPKEKVQGAKIGRVGRPRVTGVPRDDASATHKVLPDEADGRSCCVRGCTILLKPLSGVGVGYFQFIADRNRLKAV